MAKVCINTYPTAFITPGGGEVQLRKTYEHLLKQGCQVELYNQWEPNLDRFDIVHYFSVYGGSLDFCQKVKESGKKLVVSPVIWLDDMKKYPVGEIQAILNLADLILPNSQAEAEMLNQKLGIPMEKFHIVYNAVEPDVFSNIDSDLFRNKYKLGKYMLNVANIEPRKNQKTLIEAVREVDIPLVIIGHVRDEDYARECRELAREGNVYFIEPLEHNSPMLLSAYAGAELFVLPSTLETPGLAALEAAAAGCKRLLLTDIGSAREYFGERADYIEDIYNVDLLQKMLSDILKRDNTLSDGSIKKYILSSFSWKNASCSTLDSYIKVLKSDFVPQNVDINDKNIKLLSGWYELEYDGSKHFRWMSQNGYFEIKPGKITLLFYLPIDTEIKFGENAWEFYRKGLHEVEIHEVDAKKIQISLKEYFSVKDDTRELGIKVFYVLWKGGKK